MGRDKTGLLLERAGFNPENEVVKATQLWALGQGGCGSPLTWGAVGPQFTHEGRRSRRPGGGLGRG